jgi:lambda family phage portal protein
MGLFRLFQRNPAPSKRNVSIRIARKYDAAAVSRLERDWMVPDFSSGDTEIYQALNRVRERARDQARNNAWVASYRAVLERNVVGPGGFTLHSLAVTRRGLADEAAREAVESVWLEWGRAVTVDGRHNFRSLCAAILDTWAIAGEVFVLRRVVDGRLLLRVCEPEMVDLQKNERLSNGHDIRMGVERAESGMPVAYWFFRQHPGDVAFPSDGARAYRDHVRIPASEVIHFYRPDRPCDTRGISPLAPALWTLKQLTEYERAELVAARKQANEGVYFEPQVPTDWAGNVEQVEEEGEPNDAENIDVISEIGQGVVLPPGVKPHFYNPTHPNDQFGYFITQCVRRFAASQGLSYHTLAGDLEKVNYSSAQLGGIEERATFAEHQRRLIDWVADRIFGWWLETELLSGGIEGMSMVDYDRLAPHEFSGRVWPGAQPREEAEAAQVMQENGWKSPQEIIRQITGRDPWTVMEERKQWEEWHAAIGLALPQGTAARPKSENSEENVDTSP